MTRKGLRHLPAPHPVEGKEAHEECVRLHGLAHRMPIRERPFHLMHDGKDIGPHETASQVVVCFVSSFLHVHKGSRKSHEPILKWQPAESSDELRRYIASGKLPGNSIHRSMVKGAA